MEGSGVSLTGRTALITGAAKRIGRAMALALAQNGVRIVVHYSRSEQEAKALCKEIEGIGVAVWPVKGDLVDPGQAEAIFKEAVDRAGAIDILINSASIFNVETIWEMTDESLCTNMRIHAMAALILSKALAKQQRPGHIINLLDTRVVSYDKDHAAYHISKRSLLTLTRILALELAPKIAVNAVAPGLILPSALQDETYLDKLAPTTPLQRHGSPADVVQAVLFLLRSRFITGQIIYVDGGYHMRGHLYD
jgi:NAD(P)-dependent dehydrogenase (short-subunit alcohol dehydrogenase family)